ncbi:MAG: hypothetical protein L0Y79_04320 [Chlorobi bacterium]|nr:hypothetical protein [Chlorobiota bacterium]MCI0717144.1 hypothetical protein [Chlorobiota bacterium]
MKHLKQSYRLLIILILILQFDYTFTQNNDKDYFKWKYFEIFCDARNDTMLLNIQNILDFGINYEFYSLIIDIRSSDLNNKCIYLTGEYFFEPASRKWSWFDLPIDYRNYLIAYKPDILIKKKLPD